MSAFFVSAFFITQYIIHVPIASAASFSKQAPHQTAQTAGGAFSDKNCDNNQLSAVENATVKWVYDGDTLLLTDKRKIRLIGIDTPETKHHKQRAEAYGAKAKEALRELLKSHGYKIQLRFGKERHDRYKRTLAHVFLADGTNVSNWLLVRGYAKSLAFPPNVLLADCYRQSEAYAQEKSLRIWKYKKNKLRNVNSLSPRIKGYVRLEGTVQGIRKKKKSITLELKSRSKHRIQLKIKKRNIVYFKSYNIDKLRNKLIRVSGILKNKHNKRTLYLSHPSQIETQTEVEQRENTTRSAVQAEQKRQSTRVAPIIKWSSNNDSEKRN